MVYLLFPDLSPRAVCCFSGILLTIYGIIKIVGFFPEDLYCLAFHYDLAFGLLILVVGILVLAKPTLAFKYLTAGLGWIALLDSLLKLQMSAEAKSSGLKQWYLILAIAVITDIFSLLLIIKGSSSPQVIRMLAGATLFWKRSPMAVWSNLRSALLTRPIRRTRTI